jgi:hypothetical protein
MLGFGGGGDQYLATVLVLMDDLAGDVVQRISPSKKEIAESVNPSLVTGTLTSAATRSSNGVHPASRVTGVDRQPTANVFLAASRNRQRNVHAR